MVTGVFGIIAIYVSAEGDLKFLTNIFVELYLNNGLSAEEAIHMQQRHRHVVEKTLFIQVSHPLCDKGPSSSLSDPSLCQQVPFWGKIPAV